MSDEKTRDELELELSEEILRIFDHFAPGGSMAPVQDSQEWEQLLASLPPRERELKQELANFARLWECMERANLKLSSSDADAVQAAARLPIEQRIERFREINRSLLKRLGDAAQGAQLRM